MGCTSSAISPSHELEEEKTAKQLDSKKDKIVKTNEYRDGNIKTSKPSDSSPDKRKQNIDSNANKLDPMAQRPVPKSVAFDVTLDGQNADSLLSTRKRPPKLQALEPLSVPKLTAEQLQEKQRLADEKREKLKQKKIRLSQKSSRRRRELTEAQEFGQKQQSEQDKVAHIHNPDDDVEIERDEGFSTHDNNDTWPGIPDRINNTDFEKNRLQKNLGQVKPTMSASPVGISDSAFRQSKTESTLQTIHNLKNNVHIMSDDFFDS